MGSSALGASVFVTRIMPSGTVYSTSTTIAKTILGAGILALPFAYAQTGQMLGTALLLVAGIAQFFTLHLLGWLVVDARARHGDGHVPSFHSLAIDAFGSQRAGVAVEVVNAIHTFGTACSLLLVIGDLVPQVVSIFGALPREEAWLEKQWVWISIIGVFVVLPLFFQPSLDGLRCFSALGNASVALIAVVTVAFAVGLLQTPVPDAPITLAPPRPTWSGFAGQLECLSIYIFAFACAYNVPAAIIEMARPSMARVDAAIGTGVGLASILYVLVAWCGSAAFGANVGADLLAYFPNEEILSPYWDATDGARNTASAVGALCRLAMLLNLCVTVPIMLHPTRGSVCQIFLGRHPSTLSSVSWAACTLGLFAGAWAVAVSVSSLDAVMGFVGATTGMLIGFTIPCMLYERLAARKSAAIQSTDADTLVTPYLLAADAGVVSPDDDLDDEASTIAAPWTVQLARVVGRASLLMVPVLLTAQFFSLTRSSE